VNERSSSSTARPPTPPRAGRASGTIVTQCTGLADELAVAACDLDATTAYRSTVFDLARHREPSQYGLITDEP